MHAREKIRCAAAWDSHAVVQLPMQCPTPPHNYPHPTGQLTSSHILSHSHPES